jgi:2-polyprenyl-3-methyl-5-hydroxy-6-metoxy-1,4-benzoquinol methylase
MAAQAPAYDAELLEKVRQQFDSAPYPRVPLDKSPKDNPNLLYIHNLVTPYYLRHQKVINTKGKTILDAGCGSGWKSLLLAEANPGAKIVGVDISGESVKLAHQRLQYHGVEDAEFHMMLLEDLPKLGLEFDYINCDDVLYLLPDAVAGLQAMKSVLKQDGIIRANFHSSLQRASYFRAQKLFKYMGLMDNNPGEIEIGIVRETIKALKDNVILKTKTWNPRCEESEEAILANHLLVGDKGFTIPEFFRCLESANLEFINVVNWLKWDLMELFKEPDNLPAYLAMSLPELSAEEKLHLFELFNPVHRLLDIWCGHPDEASTFLPIEEWTDSDWRIAQAYLHPQLKTPKSREDLVACVTEMKVFPISEHISLIDQLVSIDSSMALCFFPLLERPQSIKSLVERWMQIRPLDPITLKPTDRQQAFEMVKLLLLRLEGLGYIMLERLN